MIKGCQKRIVHITNTGSPYFEEAYFILKRGGDIPTAENDMIRAALCIAEEAAKGAKPKARRAARRSGALILVGASVCSLVFGIIMLIFTVCAG